MVLFDDMQVQTGWKSLGPMNKALTSTSITERVLSRSRTATARTNVLFMGTGNNVEPGQDMRRRVLSIRLAPRSETPTLQQYSFNPVAHVRKRRSHIVQAALTIIEAHRLAGRPVCDVPSIGSYEEWSLICRQPLLWLGEPDPATSLIQQVQDDTDQDILGDFLQHWSRLFGDEPMMVREVVPHAAKDDRFAEALDEIGVMDGATVNKKKLGWYLKLNRSRWANGLKIESGPNSQRNTWRVAFAKIHLKSYADQEASMRSRATCRSRRPPWRSSNSCRASRTARGLCPTLKPAFPSCRSSTVGSARSGRPNCRVFAFMTFGTRRHRSWSTAVSISSPSERCLVTPAIRAPSATATSPMIPY